MSSTCDIVAERIALGEPLGDAADHAASCERCKRVVALPVELGAMHREAEPGMGFSARMTAGAQHRIVVRRRRRIAAGLAAAVAASAVGFFALTREPAKAPLAQQNPPAQNQAAGHSNERDPWATDSDAAPSSDDDDLRAIVKLANTDRSMHVSADWKSIEEPLAPYGALLRGVDHE